MAAAGVLAAAGGIVATALPAAAASPNEAYAASAFGLINHGPIAEATFPGTSPVAQRFGNIFSLLSAGRIHDQADATSASSVVSAANATRLGGLNLTDLAVASQCSSDGKTVSGGTLIFWGKIRGHSGPIRLPAFPAPNTRYSLPYGARVTLNKQSTAEDGTLTVTAIYASLRGGAEHLSIGVSVCNTADLTPPTPTPTPTVTPTVSVSATVAPPG